MNDPEDGGSPPPMPAGLLPTALVTGGAVRIGRTLVQSLAELGFAVAIHCNRSRAAAEELAQTICGAGGRAVVVAADLTDADAAAGLAERACTALGEPIGILVNNAASFDPDRLATLDQGRLRRQLAINLEAPLLVTQGYVKALPGASSGLVVTVNDQRVANPTASYLSYSVSKAGLAMATAVLARELAPRVRVNALALGQVLKAPGMDEERFRSMVAETPLRRATTLPEIAHALRFIIRSPSMTGTTLTLDSGMAMGWRYPPPDR